MATFVPLGEIASRDNSCDSNDMFLTFTMVSSWLPFDVIRQILFPRHMPLMQHFSSSVWAMNVHCCHELVTADTFYSDAAALIVVGDTLNVCGQFITTGFAEQQSGFKLEILLRQKVEY